MSDASVLLNHGDILARKRAAAVLAIIKSHCAAPCHDHAAGPWPLRVLVA
jgi:hypothetical protein